MNYHVDVKNWVCSDLTLNLQGRMVNHAHDSLDVFHISKIGPSEEWWSLEESTYNYLSSSDTKTYDGSQRILRTGHEVQRLDW